MFNEMSRQDERIHCQRSLEFGGIKHDVKISVESNKLLVIYIEKCMTLDQWVGKYDASYVEELSHKTGNFKQFTIFCSMLESALLQNSESVALDLLTYQDLNVLREHKIGSTYQNKHKPAVSDKLNTKRYLIMTYTVEFDQIHYPLPLTYTGKTDSEGLKKQIFKLKEEIRVSKETAHSESFVHKLEVENEKLTIENKELKEAIKQSNLQLKQLEECNMSKELKVLKKVIKNLEADLLQERNKHQHILSKKKKEFAELLEKFQDLKANERNYRIRCKNLSEELSMLKTKSLISPMINKRNNTKYKLKSGSSSRNYHPMRRNEVTPPLNSSRGRRSTRSKSKDRECSASLRRTPSPGFNRFDPSAYIREKERKKKEAAESASWHRTPSSNSKHNQNRSYSGRSNDSSLHLKNSRRRSKCSSVECDKGSMYKLNKKASGPSKRSFRGNGSRSANLDASDDEFYKHEYTKNVSNSVKTYILNEDNTSANHSIGIAEIDARLEALQKFMQNNVD